MAISVTCQSCGNAISAPEAWQGRKARCQRCGNIVTVPTLGGAAAPGLGQVVEPAPVVLDPVDVQPRAQAAPTGFASSAAPVGELPQAEIIPVQPQSAGGNIVAARELAAVKAMVERGSYLDATRALNSLESAAGGNPVFYYLRGTAYTGLGNYPLALTDLTRAVENGVRTPEVFSAKGRAELSLGRYQNAIESLDTALELAGTDIPDYMADLAKAYDGARMPRDAAATWGALAQINPNHPAIIERQRQQQQVQAMRSQQQAQAAMVQMQGEQRSQNTACWVCYLLACLCNNCG